MTQKGTHTWDIVFHYHRCSRCGYIIESRKQYRYRLGKYVKELECGRCHHAFTLTKGGGPSFGPLMGDPQPAEVEWNG